MPDFGATEFLTRVKVCGSPGVSDGGPPLACVNLCSRTSFPNVPVKMVSFRNHRCPLRGAVGCAFAGAFANVPADHPSSSYPPSPYQTLDSQVLRQVFPLGLDRVSCTPFSESVPKAPRG